MPYSALALHFLRNYLLGAGFPFQVESLEDGVDDAIHAFYVHKTHHGSGAAADFDKAAPDHVGGAQFAPQVPWGGEERQQLGQILLQPPDHDGISPAPAGAESDACLYSAILTRPAKVNELMSLCARLEVQLTTTHSETRRLLEAVLYHVLKDSHSEGGEGAFARA